MSAPSEPAADLRADLPYERAEELSPLVARVLARNPNIMTGSGTNTYIVGTGPVIVIDVGPEDDEHLAAVTAAVDGRPVAAVLSTHHHSDHAPGSMPFAAAAGAPVWARRHEQGPVVDRELEDGEVVEAGGAHLQAVFTPGHASDHLCFLFAEEEALFSGDHIMSGSTVVIAPPDGHMATYLESLRRVLELPFSRIYPGHGPVIADGPATVRDYIVHRGERREQVSARLRAGDRTVEAIVGSVYLGVPEKLHPIARFSVQAHLHQLRDEGLATAAGDPLDLATEWHPA